MENPSPGVTLSVAQLLMTGRWDHSLVRHTYTTEHGRPLWHGVRRMMQHGCCAKSAYAERQVAKT